MVIEEVIKKRMQKLAQSLDKIARYRDLSYDEFLQDDIAQDIVEYNLLIAINMITDMATHIVLDNNIGNPNTMGEAFEILSKERYITVDEAATYKQMVGFRNILSHEYVKINKKVVYDIMKSNLKDFKKFILFVNDNFLQ
ncbi:type VII toxin-antitoxin system HepT family RNase toxin [Alkaliphilus hydrothermalis]|uniref:Uncharacterized protein YutE (UPF0331/DUF86 family) n=1 Tax=Alkaliphilus hydrothermalis TaxID=1482730 RepID=A0ABS2NPN6_9FIRM|nr:DUF86 domain-containing protein [Alkaliphilus hydrothermalis]MBM7614544.1 uncharacterized protein YutE (UPF0331/DUF86 family) [Alkaliphilus hydrothermalis]